MKPHLTSDGETVYTDGRGKVTGGTDPSYIKGSDPVVESSIAIEGRRYGNHKSSTGDLPGWLLKAQLFGFVIGAIIGTVMIWVQTEKPTLTFSFIFELLFLGVFIGGGAGMAIWSILICIWKVIKWTLSPIIRKFRG